MCTRYLLLRNARALAAELGLVDAPEIPPRYNAAPRQLLPIVRRGRTGGPGREALLARWGFAPDPVAVGPGRTALINARAETAAEKPTFRDAFRARRCVVPADGFYEWERTAGGPQPWLFEPAAGRSLLLLAGLWTVEGAECAFVVLTTPPNALVAPLHHRMPALLPAPAVDSWLDPATPAERLAALLAPWPATLMRARPVHPRLNKVACDEPGCLEPPPATVRQLDLSLE